MKLSLLITCLLISFYASAQIEIIDKSKQHLIKAVPYDGSFINFDDVMLTKEKKAGIVGLKITIIELFKIKKATGEEISFTDLKKLENKTFDVVGYFNEYKDVLNIKDEKQEYIFEPQSTDIFIINDYIDSVKSKLENKVFNPLKIKTELTSLDNSNTIFDGNTDYKISKVGFGKVNFGYGIILEINNQSYNYPNKYFFDQPNKNGWIKIVGSDILENKLTLIEKHAFSIFSNSNKIFLNDIRNAKVKIGMTEDQCLISWGDPTASMKNIGGYDVVFRYGDTGKSTNLYFKGGILKLIK